MYMHFQLTPANRGLGNRAEQRARVSRLSAHVNKTAISIIRPRLALQLRYARRVPIFNRTQIHNFRSNLLVSRATIDF